MSSTKDNGARPFRAIRCSPSASKAQRRVIRWWSPGPTTRTTSAPTRPLSLRVENAAANARQRHRGEVNMKNAGGLIAAAAMLLAATIYPVFAQNSKPGDGLAKYDGLAVGRQMLAED